MRSVMLSIQPKWCELIANGKKTVEVRKTKPKLETPFKVYIYCTSIAWVNLDEYVKLHIATSGRIDEWHGKVIGEFVCDHIGYVRNYGDMVDSYDCIASCLSAHEIIEYAKDKNGNFVYTYGWHISDLKIYDKPKELGEFRKYNPFFEGVSTEELEANGVSGVRIKRPPQSWCYVKKGGER